MVKFELFRRDLLCNGSVYLEEISCVNDSVYCLEEICYVMTQYIVQKRLTL